MDTLERIEIEERCDLSDAAAKVRITPDGYLVAQPRVARTGIQVYSGAELGRPDLKEVRIYRPADEVFAKKAMATLAHRPITLDHPDTKVDASNWRKLAIGKSDGDVVRDGDYVRVPLVLMDAQAIAAAQSGKSQLSVGYDAALIWGEGQTPSGEFYDAVQTDIRANHIALVTTARGGDNLKLGDREFSQQEREAAAEKGQAMPGGGFPIKSEQDLKNAIRAVGRAKNPAAAKAHIKKRARALGLTKLIPESWGDGEGDQQNDHRSKTMTERTLVIDGVTIALDDKDGQILERHLKTLNDAAADASKRLGASEGRIAEMQKAIETKDGEILGLTKKLADAEWTPQKRDQAIRDSMEVFDRARRVLGDKLVTDGKTEIAIKREVVAAELGDEETKALSDEAVAGVFRAVTRDAKTNDSGLVRTGRALSQLTPQPNLADAAYQKYVERLANAHKQKTA